MNITLATKNITETFDGFGIIIAVHGHNEKWLASFEEDKERNVRLNAPIKVLHQVGENKKQWRSYKEWNITNELIHKLDKVVDMFDNAPSSAKRVLL